MWFRCTSIPFCWWCFFVSSCTKIFVVVASFVFASTPHHRRTFHHANPPQIEVEKKRVIVDLIIRMMLNFNMRPSHHLVLLACASMQSTTTKSSSFSFSLSPPCLPCLLLLHLVATTIRSQHITKEHFSQAVVVGITHCQKHKKHIPCQHFVCFVVTLSPLHKYIPVSNKFQGPSNI